ncbi:MAG: hypothetical protein ACTHKR_08935 [Sphingomonas sp.]
MGKSPTMILPEGIAPEHAHLPDARRRPGLLSLIVLGLLMIAALAGVFGGGRGATLTAASPQATLTVHTNRVLRNGVFFETRIAIAAHTDLADATVVLPPSLWRDMTINSTVPQAASEEFKTGAFRFHYGKLAAGEALELKIDGQINPPLFRGTRGFIALADGDRALVSIPVSITVLP